MTDIRRHTTTVVRELRALAASLEAEEQLLVSFSEELGYEKFDGGGFEPNGNYTVTIQVKKR